MGATDSEIKVDEVRLGKEKKRSVVAGFERLCPRLSFRF